MTSYPEMSKDIAEVPNTSTSPEADESLSPQDGFRYQLQQNQQQQPLPLAATPPPYSGPSSSAPLAPTPSTFPNLPKINYALYLPPSFRLSPDDTTITSSAPALCDNAGTLRDFLQAQATVPPKLVVQVIGTSSGGNVDFDIKLNMMTFLYGGSGDNQTQQRWNYIKTLDEGELGFRGSTKKSIEPSLSGGLEAWIKKFCEDDGLKQFTLERTVTNWDTDYIEGRLHSLIASTLYRGRVVVTFPTTHYKVSIRSTFQNRNFLTNVTNIFSTTRKYEVVKAIWPYASVKPGGDARLFAVMSEEAWWADWKDAIRHAVLSKRKGWVTIEDQLEFLMGRKKLPVDAREWGLGGERESRWGVPQDWVS